MSNGLAVRFKSTQSERGTLSIWKVGVVRLRTNQEFSIRIFVKKLIIQDGPASREVVKIERFL